MMIIQTHPKASLLSGRLAQARRTTYAMQPLGSMRGPLTDRVRSMLPTLAVLVGGVLIGYMLRKPIGKAVNKVT